MPGRVKLAAVSELDHTVSAEDIVRIAFIDFIDWDYTPQTPRERPLGGTQSGLCYLAEAMAKQGHYVFLINNVKKLERVRGVQCIPLTLDGPKLREIFNTIKADVLIVLSASDAARQLRPWVPLGTRMYLWTGHASNQPHHEGLADLENKKAWNGFIFMGQWQLDTVAEKYDLDKSNCVNLGMGIAPAFERVFSEDERIVDAMGEHPTLVYTSTPFRGLDILVKCFPAIRERVPNVQLRVFSSMKIYQMDDEADKFSQLYETCRTTPGIDYVGPVPQPQLARELKSATMLAYSNSFAETACVAMMEAMASGCMIVSSHLGALPETTAGYARLLNEKPGTEAYEKAFVNQVVEALDAVSGGERDAVEKHLQEQVGYCQEHYRWDAKVGVWIQWLEKMAS